MAEPTPQSPKDPKALAALRDQLEDYLLTTERNTDAVNVWLGDNKSRIVLFHQKLNRALNEKNDARATALLKEMGDAAGFVLSLQDFKTRAQQAFGKGSAFEKAAALVAPGLPTALQEPLPEISASDVRLLSSIDQQALMQALKNNENWWTSVSGWFNRDRKQQEEKTKKTYLQLHAVKAEILGLQSERHYYIDSLMDWVADALASDLASGEKEAQQEENKTPLQLSYQDPAYVIAIAQADYQEAVEARARDIRETALQYAGLAEAIDKQDAEGILGKLPIVNAAGSPVQVYMHQLLLEDYQAASLAELALKHIDARDNQAKVLNWIFENGRGKLAFSDVRTAPEILEKFVQLTLDKKDPLDPAILRWTLARLNSQYKASLDGLVIPGPGAFTLFQRAAHRFENELPAQKEVLNAIFSAYDQKSYEAVLEPYIAFNAQLQKKNVSGLLGTMREMGEAGLAGAFVSLWSLCHPGVSLLGSLRAVSTDPAAKALLLDQGLQAGLLGEIVLSENNSEGIRKFKQIMESDILPAPGAVPLETVRRLLAHSLPEDTTQFRRWLSHTSENWLGKIAASSLPGDEKAEWIAAVLAPFPSDIVKANILDEAARNIKTGMAFAALSGMERNLIGENVRLTENKILCNLPAIANVWYSPANKTLRYTIRGESHTLLENLTAPMAEEVLSLLQRRGNFMREQGGLFKPENIDAIHYGKQGATISWYHVTGSLNADPYTLQKLQAREDFLHVTGSGGNILVTSTGGSDKIVSSYNTESICLLQKLTDGTHLLIDKYGAASVLEGKIILPQEGPLVNLGTGYFNPENASIIRMDPAGNKFEFRIESPDFEKLLDADENQFFYSVTAGAAGFKALQKALAVSTGVLSPNSGALANLHLNMKALGYLAYSDDDGYSGFYCKRYGANRKPGFINVEPEMAKAIVDGLEKKGEIVRAGSLVTHKDNIDDVYYNLVTKTLQFIIGAEIQEAPLMPFDAYKILSALIKDPAFAEVSADNTAEKEMPTDVVQLARATLVTRDKFTPERMSIIAGNAPFPVNMDPVSARDFWESLETSGLMAARKETRAMPWAQKLKAAVAGLSPVEIARPPVLAELKPAELVNKILDKASAVKKEAKAQPKKNPASEETPATSRRPVPYKPPYNPPSC